MMIALIVS